MARNIPGLRISPLGVVETAKFRTLYDLTFPRDDSLSEGNAHTDFSQTPSCKLEHLLRDITNRLFILAQEIRQNREYYDPPYE